MKRFSLVLALLLAFSGTCVSAASSASSVTSDGNKYINISRSYDWKADEDVTFNVINVSGEEKSGADLTWEDIIEKALVEPEIIAYYNNGAVEYNKKGNKCTFNIVLEDSGIYKCFVSNQSGDTDVFTISHIIKSAEITAADDIISACSGEKEAAVASIKTIIENNIYNLGIFDDLYEVVDSSDASQTTVAGFIYDYVKNDFDKNAENYSQILANAVVRAYMAESINMGRTTDLYNHEYAIGYDALGLTKFEKKQYSNILNRKMCAKTYTSIAAYDKALMETVTGIVIEHNDGSGEIPSILKQLAEVSGINKTKVTSSLCDSIAGSNKYYDFDTLKSYVEKYKEPKKEHGGNSPGLGGPVRPVEVEAGIDNKNDISTGRPVFNDVGEEYWARTYIEQLYRDGIVSGINASEFAPENLVTREEFVKLLVMALKLNTVGSDAPFNDIDKNEWYFDYVNIAYNSDIVNGISEDTFGVGQNIIRQDIAVMVANALKLLDYDFADGEELSFNDNGAIDDYAKEAVKLLKNAGILAGDENNFFNPKACATRAEAAKIIYMISR